MAQQQNLVKLASQNRAFSSTRPWSAEELIALSTLINERDLSRATAAEYIRNGISTVDVYDAAVKANFVPKTLEEIQEEAVKAHLEDVQEQLKPKEEKEIPVKESPVKAAKKATIKK